MTDYGSKLLNFPFFWRSMLLVSSVFAFFQFQVLKSKGLFL